MNLTNIFPVHFLPILKPLFSLTTASPCHHSCSHHSFKLFHICLLLLHRRTTHQTDPAEERQHLNYQHKIPRSVNKQWQTHPYSSTHSNCSFSFAHSLYVRWYNVCIFKKKIPHTTSVHYLCTHTIRFLLFWKEIPPSLLSYIHYLFLVKPSFNECLFTIIYFKPLSNKNVPIYVTKLCNTYLIFWVCSASNFFEYKISFTNRGIKRFKSSHYFTCAFLCMKKCNI